MKNLMIGLMAFAFVGCAGYVVEFEDKETGVSLEMNEGKLCGDDGKRFSGCLERPVPKEKSDESRK